MIVTACFAFAALLNLIVAWRSKDDKSTYLLATILFGSIAYFSV